MKNLSVELEDRPGALAEVGEVLGRAGVSIEGGGVFVVNGKGVANFLFEDGSAARQALDSAGILVVKENDVVLQKLNQGLPGQLGKLLRHMADAGVNIEVQYSDHEHQLVLVADDASRAREVSESWMRERASAPLEASRAAKKHHYVATVEWNGNQGVGTSSYSSYLRDFVVSAKGKTTIDGSSDPAFRGDRSRYNPEELLVAALSSCHMLWYLHLCAINSVVVLAYKDESSGTMIEDPTGSGRFTEVRLAPVVTISSDSDPVRAKELHQEAHRNCFIANSVNFAIVLDPEIEVLASREG
jgi:organic hydroperoxide reductase OsmC/OhrA